MPDMEQSRVIIRDASGVVFDSFQRNTWLSSLVEDMPEVRTSFLEIPASDGSIDLTEAIANRPLYTRRHVEITVSHWAHSFAQATEWAHAVAREIHGRELMIETPSTRALLGYYQGRVTVETDFSLKPAVILTIKAECAPWIFYGNVEIELTPGTTTSIDQTQELPDALRSAYPLSLVALQRRVDSFGTQYAAAGRRVALVEGRTSNIVSMPGMFAFARWDMESGGNTLTDWEYTAVQTASNSISFETDKANNTRMMALTYAEDSPQDETKMACINVSDRKVYLGLRVRGSVTATGDNPSIKVLHQGGRGVMNTGAGRAIDSAAGGLANADSTLRVTYTDCPITDGVVDSFANMCADVIVWGATHTLSSGAVGVGVEVVDCTAQLVVNVYYGWVAEPSYVEPNNTIRTLSLPVGMYAATGKQDRIDISQLGTVLTSNFQESGTAVTPLDAPVTYQLSNIALQGEPLYVNAFFTNLRWTALTDTITLTNQQTEDIDAGDMPTSFTIETVNPLIVTIDGEQYMVTSSGYAPFAFSGEKSVDYLLYGNESAYIRYDKGRL